MAKDHGVETERTDIETRLVSLADQLRVCGQALGSMAAEAGDRTSIEGRVQGELAARLDAVARQLDIIRPHLCRSCRTVAVVERASLHPGAYGMKTR